jgi:hypothetical protein
MLWPMATAKATGYEREGEWKLVICALSGSTMFFYITS